MVGEAVYGLGSEKMIKGDGRGWDGETKLLRSSWQNLEGGVFSVSTSSISLACNLYQDTSKMQSDHAKINHAWGRVK